MGEPYVHNHEGGYGKVLLQTLPEEIQQGTGGLLSGARTLGARIITSPVAGTPTNFAWAAP